MKIQQRNKWYFGNWQVLGWVETGFKIFAFMFAYLLLYNALSFGNFALPNGKLLIVWIVQIILSLGLLAAIFDRFKNKEIFAMIFVLFNNLAHWGVVIAMTNMANMANLTINLILFYSLMLTGDLVKIIFLKTSGFKIDGVPQYALYGLTGVFIAGYLTNLLILLF